MRPPTRLLLGRLCALAGALAGCSAPVDPPVGAEGCVLAACHGRVEAIHYGGDPLACIDCHGGDPAAVTKEAGHPTVTVSFNPSTPGVNEPDGRLLEGATLSELDDLDFEILKFLNPSDHRVVRETCGSPTRGGGNCHTRIVNRSLLSSHATLSGQLAGGLYFGGLTDKDTRFAVLATTDEHAIDRWGLTGELALLPGDPTTMSPSGEAARGYFASFGQSCVECHLSADNPKIPGNYTSSGCNACHVVTNDDARPLTTDLTQKRDELGHGALHRFTNLIPDSQCNHCHHAHLHRGLLIQGIRERSEPDGDTPMGGLNRGDEDPPDAIYWSEQNYVRHQGDHILYGKPYPFYIEDEDGTNDVDETPPDVHFEKGMACIDCHNMAELHGGDHMPVRRDFETRVRCETCHGAPAATIDPEAAPFEIAISLVGGNARNQKVVLLGEDGKLSQRGKLSGLDHPLTQIAERVDPSHEDFNPRTQMGCALHAGSAEVRAALSARFAAASPSEVDELFPGMPEGSTLPDDLGERDGRVECFTCHNAWTLNCYGCHMVRDDRDVTIDMVTGSATMGRVSSFAMSSVPDALSLGFNARGRISPMVGTSVFFTWTGASGDTLIDAAPLVTVDGFSGDGNQHNPVHHHTIRREPRDCQGCHPRADGLPDDEDALKRAAGFGTGRYVFLDGAGRTHLLDRTVAFDVDGDGTWEDPTAPLAPLWPSPVEVLPLAATTHLSLDPGGLPEPGPLDGETIDRLLRNRVVPQRP